MFFNLSQFTVWLGSQTYTLKGQSYYTIQSQHKWPRHSVVYQGIVGEMWPEVVERCGQEKFWLGSWNSWKYRTERTATNWCKDIETAIAHGDNGVDAESPKWKWWYRSGPIMKMWRQHILLCVVFYHPFQSLLSSYFPYSLAYLSYRELGSSQFWRAIITSLLAFC